MRNLLTLAVSVVACFSFSFAQKGEDSLRLIQLSGVVVSSDSLEQMPYATIFDKTVGRGTLADFFGFFSIVVQPGDTILFRYFGHHESSFIRGLPKPILRVHLLKWNRMKMRSDKLRKNFRVKALRLLPLRSDRMARFLMAMQ